MRLRFEQEEIWRAMMNASLDAVVTIDAQGRIVEFSRAAEEIFGRSRESVLGRDLAETIIPMEFREKHQAGLRRLVETGNPSILERRLELAALRADGTEFPVELTLTRLSGGKRLLFAGFLRDITQRKTDEARMRLQTAALESSANAMAIVDRGGWIEWVNPAFSRLTGYSPGEAVGMHTRILKSGRQSQEFYNDLWETVLSGHVWRGEMVNRRKDGGLYSEEMTITPVIDGQDAIRHFIAVKQDITDRKASDEELHENRAFHRSITEALGEIGVGLLIIDADHRVRFMNPVMREWFGDQTHKICHASLFDSATPCPYCQIAGVVKADKTTHYRPTISDGRVFDIVATPIQNHDGTTSVLEMFLDVTEQTRAEQDLRIAAITLESQEGVFITDEKGVILRANRAFVEMTGYSAEEAVGKTPAILKSGRHDAGFYAALWGELGRAGHWQGEVWNRRKNGEIYPEWQTITAVTAPDGAVTHYVSAFSDMTKRKEAEERIHNLAFYDALTQLPNRRLLQDRLRQALALAERSGREGALLFIDLDNFKVLNDTHGHDVGDLLLIAVANRLQSCLREGDTAGRLGGDEFVVLLEDLEPDEPVAAARAEAVGEKIRAALSQPYHLKECNHCCTASIGITLFRGPIRTADEMLKRADVALYQAKGAGRNTVMFFDPALQATLNTRLALESDLRQAFSGGHFHLHYQPQTDGAGRITGAEALLRWNHSTRGAVSPSDFIPLAEDTGLIIPMGQWVLETACMQLAAWSNDPATRELRLSVNVSARQFRQADFVDQVLVAVDRSGADPKKLVLEFTESLVLVDVEDTVEKMRRLKPLGISFSLDDFGTGHSSLSRLKRLPLDELKIDRSFVRDIATDPNDAAIVQAILAMARALGLHVVAEGVETELQRQYLERHGCPAFQGYLFGKPGPAEELIRGNRGQ